MMPEGDFRDWTEIEDWARSIAEELTQADADIWSRIPHEYTTGTTT